MGDGNDDGESMYERSSDIIADVSPPSVPRHRRVEFSIFGVRCRAIDLPRALERWIRRRWEQADEIDATNDNRIDVARCTTAPRYAPNAPVTSQTTPLDG